MEYKVFAISNTGKVRSNNEDSFFSTEKDGVFLVADGMGGHNSGEVASALTAEIIPQTLINSGVIENYEEAIRKAFFAANDKVHDQSAQNVQNKGMGSTCVLLILKGANFYIAHVGDSRVFLFRRDELKQMTRDHSYVEELFIRGLITEEEKADHPYRHQITRFIGLSQKLEVDITSGPAWNGDVFLLCSDGLTDMVSSVRLKEIFSQGLDPKETAEILIKEALDNGGQDNITVLIVKVTSKKTSFFKKILGW